MKYLSVDSHSLLLFASCSTGAKGVKNTVRTGRLLAQNPDHTATMGGWSFFVFLGPNPRHMEVPRLGVESELQLPQPQQHGIQATSVTYTTSPGNAGSLTH